MVRLSKDKRYANVFLAKNQYWADKNSDFVNQIPLIVKVINKYANISFD